MIKILQEPNRLQQLFGPSPSPLSPDQPGIAAGIQSLAVALRFRHWLTPAEEVLLDRLAIDGSRCFLLVGDDCLHPDPSTLPEMLRLDIPVDQTASGAIFARRTAARVSPATGSSVQTACFGEQNGVPLVIGQFSPSSTKMLVTDRFGHTVAQFCRSWLSASKVTEKISRCDPYIAMLLVDRGSGRVIHINDAAANRLHSDPQSIIGREYSEIAIAHPEITGGPTRFENLIVGEGSFSLISYPTNSTTQNFPTRL